MEPAKRNAQAVTWLDIFSFDYEPIPRFRPVNELGLRVNDGVVGWVPKPYSNCEYYLRLKIDCGGGFTTNLMARFCIGYEYDSVKDDLPVIAYVGDEGFKTLKEAVDYVNNQGLSGEERKIRIVGDVQTESDEVVDGDHRGRVLLPSGKDDAITVVYGRGGVFDATQQFEDPVNEAGRINDVRALVKYEWEEGGGYVPQDNPPPTPIDPIKPTELIPSECEPGPHDFRPVALAAMPNGQDSGLMELCANCDVARVSMISGVSFTLPVERGLTYVVSNLTAGALCTPNADGRYVVPTGIDLGIYAVAKPGYVVTGAPYQIPAVPADFVLDPSKLQKATAIRYNIAYEPGAGEGVSETNSVAYDAEHTVRTVGTEDGELDFLLTGHSFAGVWTNLEDGVGYAAGEVISNLTTTAGEVIALEPVWTQNVYSVIYRSAPDVADGEVVTNVAYGVEFAIIANCFSEEGYTFGGWARQDGVIGLYQLGEVVSNLVASGELVLCPEWNPIEYTVTYSPGDGYGEDYVQPNTYGVENWTIDADEAEMVRDHFVLTGWESDCGLEYGIGEAFSNLTAEAGENVGFTAQWTQNEFPVRVGKLPGHVMVQVMQGDQMIMKEDDGWYVTNGTATVYFIALDGYLFDVDPVSDVYMVEVKINGSASNPIPCPPLLTPAPWMGGTIAWDEDCQTAELSMTVTNGTAAAITNLVFAFEDRDDGSVLLTEGGGSAPVLRTEESWFTPGVTNTWRYVTVPVESAAFIAVTNGETGVVTVKFDLKKAGITPDEAAKYLGWVGWTAYGTRLYAPVCSWADEIAEYLPVSPTPVAERDINILLTDGYSVSYDGNGAAGAMATDLFIPDVPTNLTANAYTAVGYAFKGWTTNGVDVAYADGASGVNFAEPGETLALTALWNDTGVEVATFDALTNALVAATNQAASLPVTVNLTDDITVPQGGVVKVYASPAVTFAGTGKLDVSGIVPKWGEPVVVGEGLAPSDLALFDAKGVSWPVYEADGGAVVLHARGETEDFPWILDGATNVTAWVDPALTNIAAVVIDNGLQAETNTINLVALTNNLAIYGYEPALPLEKFNALLKFANAEGVGYVVPVEWYDDLDGNGYGTLADALAAGVTEVIPDFVITEETPKVIAETAEAEDGETYTAVVENNPDEGVEEPVKAVYVDGLIDLATNEQKNVTLKVESKDAEAVDPDVAKAISNKLDEVSADGFDSVAFVDLSVFFNAEKQENSELDSLITLHIPWSVRKGGTYGVVRMHDDVAQAIPQGADKAVDGEFFTVDFENREIALRVKKFSDYAVAETPPGVKVGERAYALVGDDRICTIYGTGSATNFPATFDLGSFTNAVVEDGITEIGEAFFYKCRKLNAVTLGKDVVTVGTNAFYLCLGLEKITVGNAAAVESLAGAVVIRAAFDSDGYPCMIPQIEAPGYENVLLATDNLADPKWEPIDPKEAFADGAPARFFKFVIRPITVK